ncbi:hypothetical protein EAF04_009538 [Stromatinia cepivora]|nr:hypothetical protein EAF04_009538 [Stromatinia cepivora]
MNPSKSYQSTSQELQADSSTGTNMAKNTANGQWTNHHKQSQYTDINRAWSTNSSANDGNSQTQTQGFLSSSSATNAGSLTPMERWAAESSKQAPWNSIGSIGTSSNNTGAGYSNNSGHQQQQAGDDWSICGNQSTK